MVRLGMAWRGYFYTKGKAMKFDVEVDQLEVGTTIEQSVVERIVGIKRQDNEAAYQFLVMQLAEFISNALWKIGKQYTVRTSGGEVLVLTHEEASRYNDSRFDLAMEKMRRCNRRLMAVDVGQLSDEARRDHGRAMIRQSTILAMVKTAKKSISLEAETPKKPPIVLK
jgi:hypothetical protein